MKIQSNVRMFFLENVEVASLCSGVVLLVVVFVVVWDGGGVLGGGIVVGGGVGDGVVCWA